MGNNCKTLLLIDGHALAFREYYALERTGMQTTDGQPTWAVYGFFNSIFELLKNRSIKFDAIAVAFDVSHRTFRVEKYENYKSNRAQMPTLMRPQMDLIYDGLKAFNIPIYTKEGFEADDVIGTISKRACELGHNVFILTGDQDAFQLIDEKGCVKVIIPFKGDMKIYDWKAVNRKLGVFPNQIIDYKALRGDSSDCIPGINGIGEKTARYLLSEFGSLENVFANVDNIQGNAIKEKIKNGEEIARLSYYLATIVRDVDIDFDFEKTKLEKPDVDKVMDFFNTMQFYKFVKNAESILSIFKVNTRKLKIDKGILDTPEEGAQNQIQLGLFSQVVQIDASTKKKMKPSTFSSKLVVDSTDFEALCNNLKNQNIISLNIKSRFLNAVDNYIVGIGIAYKEGLCFNGRNLNCCENETQSFYIPVRQRTIENNLNIDTVINGLKPIFENKNINKVVHNSKDTYNVLKNVGVDIEGIIFDVELASYISNPSVKHDLDIQSFANLNHTITQFAISDDIKKSKILIENVNINDVVKTVCDENFAILELSDFWYDNLDEYRLKILNEIELPMAKVLADLEYTGVAIDTEYLNDFSKDLASKLKKIETKIYDIAGCGFNINSTKQVAEVLFETLKIKPPKKKKSTSAEVLEELAGEHKIAKLLLEYRKFSKLKSTYTDALPELVSEKDHRIHTTFNQTVTSTGRLSSSNPNLQNIPVRTVEGNKIRTAFVPEDRKGSVILSADYSQIELRLLAHISQDENLINAYINDIDVHSLTASKVFDVPIENVTKDMRYKAKAVNFGIIYGQSKYGLAKALGISIDEADEFINRYFMTYPKIKTYMDSTIRFVDKHGYVETVFGRRRYLPEIHSSNVMIREFGKRAAINQPMQGTAADLMKFAMIKCYKLLNEGNFKSKMILQVHDEIVVETLRSELSKVKKLVTKSMELDQPLRVPLKIDISTGETWKAV